MKAYNEIFENNKKWVASKKATNKDFFKHLSEGQSPEVLYIGCSDSRVSAEEMTGMGPGEMFVHRNIANVVANNDLSAASVIEYAVDVLQVKHYCGGVLAAMKPQDLGILNPWLRNIRDVYRLHQSELSSISDEDAKYRRLVELNVQEQCINVIKTAVLQKHYLNTGFPTVHGWVFDIKTGELIDLKIDFDDKLKHIQEIYDLGKELKQ
jgi:carbonic anhydrase